VTNIRLIFTIAMLTLGPGTLCAQDARPTEASVRKVFAVTHVDSMLNSYTAQLATSMHTGVEHVMADQPLNDAQQKIIDSMTDKMVVLMREQLDWASIEPKMVQLYRDTFTQHEIDSMLAWYDSPTGRSVIAKQPVVMQQMTDYAQLHVKDMVPKLLKLQKDTIAQLRAAATAPADAPAPAAAPKP
jgi:uncharacterized protein